MPVLLGVDTGGTYTDAVLIRDESEVLASAKALTTREDLAVGVGAAVRSVLRISGIDPSQIAMASLSTTLATNALVEGQGGRVALIFIGFDAADLDRHGVQQALAGDPVLVLAGGHSYSGAQATPLDEAALEAFLNTEAADVTGFAVASVFATRNPAHEQRAAAIISERTGLPVTCSHQLSARLNGPKRAVTAVLNARLIGMIDGLINRAEAGLRDLGVTADLMVVRGDGALMSLTQARARPIETILSGPAASIVGAHWLTGVDRALVSDIGGTTTDVAVIRDGKPAIDPQGAQVGAHRTMVEAVAMRTTGLGGDSEVHVITQGLAGGLRLGPRRVVPISLLATQAPEIVHRALERSANAPLVSELDARFVRAQAGMCVSGLGDRDRALLDRIGAEVQPLSAVLHTRMDHAALGRLWDRGLVQVSTVTPTDASHVLRQQGDWDHEAATKALAVLARRRVGSGDLLTKDAKTLAQMIVDQLTEQTCLALLETVFAEEAGDFPAPPRDLAQHVLLQRGLAHHRGLIALDAGLNIDVVGLGASAATYYPAVQHRLGGQMRLPEHGDVANAIGAVVGQLIQRQSGEITSPSDGVFRVHLDSGPTDLTSLDAALTLIETHLSQRVCGALEQAGAADIAVSITRDIRNAQVESREVFVQAEITVEAGGRPRIASL